MVNLTTKPLSSLSAKLLDSAAGQSAETKKKKRIEGRIESQVRQKTSSPAKKLSIRKPKSIAAPALCNPLLLRLNNISWLNPYLIFILFMAIFLPPTIILDLPSANALQISYTSALCLYLVKQYEKNLDRLRPDLDLSENAYAELRKRITHVSRVKFTLMTLSSIVFLLVANSTNPKVRAFLAGEQVPTGFLLGFFMALFTWVIILQATAIIINGGFIFRRVGKRNTKINLLNTDNLIVYSHVGLKTLFAMVSTLLVIPIALIVDGLNLLGPSLIILILVSPFSIIAFYLPVSGIVKKLRQTKSREIEVINQALNGDYSSLSHSHLKQNTSDMNQMDLINYKTYINSVREWPINASVTIRLIALVIFPVLTWMFSLFADTVAGFFVANQLIPWLDKTIAP